MSLEKYICLIFLALEVKREKGFSIDELDANPKTYLAAI
jgi:hypothetical protein